jgi:hypothetical protein
MQEQKRKLAKQDWRRSNEHKGETHYRWRSVTDHDDELSGLRKQL